MANEVQNKQIDELFDAILKLKNKEQCYDFFEDLCTLKELDQMAQRLCAAKCLINGDTYEEVIQKTTISSATLSRVSKCVKNGKGYNSVIKQKK